MAWAAFCIPTSMTMVLLSRLSRWKIQQSPAATATAQSSRAVVASPRLEKFSAMVLLCWTKNTAARNIRAGKARRESTLSIFAAAFSHLCLIPMPRRMGSSIVTTFCISRFFTGRLMPVDSPALAVTNCIMIGIVKSVTMLLTAVSDTESATSPFASFENTLLELPPGQHAMSTSPIVISGLRSRTAAKAHAIRGSTISCPSSPAMTALPLFRTSRKSFP